MYPEAGFRGVIRTCDAAHERGSGTLSGHKARYLYLHAGVLTYRIEISAHVEKAAPTWAELLPPALPTRLDDPGQSQCGLSIRLNVGHVLVHFLAEPIHCRRVALEEVR